MLEVCEFMFYYGLLSVTIPATRALRHALCLKFHFRVLSQQIRSLSELGVNGMVCADLQSGTVRMLAIVVWLSTLTSSALEIHDSDGCDCEDYQRPGYNSVNFSRNVTMFLKNGRKLLLDCTASHFKKYCFHQYKSDCDVFNSVSLT